MKLGLGLGISASPGTSAPDLLVRPPSIINAGWADNGNNTYTHTEGSAGAIHFTVPLVAGNSYDVKVNSTTESAGTFSIAFTGGSTTSVAGSLSNENATYTATAGVGNNMLRIFAGSGSDVVISSISVHDA